MLLEATGETPTATSQCDACMPRHQSLDVAEGLKRLILGIPAEQGGQVKGDLVVLMLRQPLLD